uniref:Uncharacterized protein n=1 Tax=Oryza rufipogon TaxID=4529 RepID=A0A0E0QPF7_ORYRU
MPRQRRWLEEERSAVGGVGRQWGQRRRLVRSRRGKGRRKRRGGWRREGEALALNLDGAVGGEHGVHAGSVAHLGLDEPHPFAGTVDLRFPDDWLRDSAGDRVVVDDRCGLVLDGFGGDRGEYLDEVDGDANGSGLVVVVDGG